MCMDSAKFGTFGTIFSCSYKLVLCLLRKAGYMDDRINAPIAGFLSALSLGLEAKSRKTLIMFLVMTRAVDSALNLVESSRGPGAWTLSNRWKYAIIHILMNLFLQSRMGMNPSVLSKPMERFYAKWSQISKNEKLLTVLWERMLLDRLPYF